MKNLMVFINPEKKFIEDFETLAKLQIDNSLNFWEKEDIIFATNFDWEYQGVKATVVDDDCFCAHRPRATKLMVICYILDKGMISDTCWFHDLDAYQLEPFDDPLGDKDAGFVFSPGDYQWAWNSGSFFFKPKFKDVFDKMKKICYSIRSQDEQALSMLLEKGVADGRYKRLNSTYNLCRLRDTADTYDLADKPIKVLHDDLIAIMNL
jgi:hypothetical protein